MQYSIVNLSKLKNITNSFRIDAEYLASNILNEEQLIKSKNGQKLKNLCQRIFSGPFGSSLKSSEYLTSGVPFIRILNMENFFLKKDNLFYISEENNKRLKSPEIIEDDIIISKIGTIGTVSILTQDVGKIANISENNIGIKVKGINPKFLLAFLNSNIGQHQILRFKSGNVQPKLNTSDVGNIFIPILSSNFQQSIADLVNTSYTLRQSADTLYKEAEEILLEELGLKNYQPQNKKCFIKNLSDTKTAERIDAEYFQPKYEDVIEKIRNYGGGAFSLCDGEIKDKNFNPKKDVKYKYIELANINSN
jgi:restriction endonuclease S subunit